MEVQRLQASQHTSSQPTQHNPTNARIRDLEAQLKKRDKDIVEMRERHEKKLDEMQASMKDAERVISKGMKKMKLMKAESHEERN